MAEVALGLVASVGGSLSGAYAGQAAKKLFEPAPAGPDTSIPGITKAVIQPATKNNPENAVPQIDPTQAIAYFQQAGQVESDGIMKGLDVYKTALVTAGQTMQSGYAAANNTLQPLASAGNQALTLYQQMMGITPESTTKGLDNRLNQIDPALSSTASLIAKLNTTVDPSERSVLNGQINAGIYAAQTGLRTSVSDAQATAAALGARPTPASPYNPNVSAVSLSHVTTRMGKEGIGGDNAVIPTAYMPGQPYNNMLTSGPAIQAYQDLGTKILGQSQGLWDTKDAANQSAIQAAQLKQAQEGAQLDSFANTYNNAYTPTAPQGFTGAEVAQHLQSTPGYQFQLDQGSQQILRNQAAVGNLGTGATQAALTEFGQNYAMGSYQNYMGNLQNLINTGTPATQQIAANQSNEGGYLANLFQLGGQAANNAYTNASNAIGTSYNNIGQTLYNAAQFNASMQMAAIQAANHTGGGGGGGGGGGSQQNQANNSQNQNQNSAAFFQGFNSGNDGGGSLPVGGTSDYVSFGGGGGGGFDGGGGGGSDVGSSGGAV